MTGLGHADRVFEHGFARLVESVTRHTALLARARKLSPIDLRAVGVIDRAGELRRGELAHALDLSSTGTSSVISRLMAAGLLDGVSGQADHRDVRLRIADGEFDQLRLAPGHQTAAVCGLLDLSVSEREQVATFVLRLVELVEQDIDAIRASCPPSRERLFSPPRWA